MRTCGVDIKGSEAIISLMSFQNGLFDLPDCRQIRFVYKDAEGTQGMRDFQFAFAKLLEDYKVSKVVIRQRMQKGKFAGSATGFKIEAAIQLIKDVEVVIITPSQIKETLRRNPLPVDFRDTGLKQFQEQAFVCAYCSLVGICDPVPKPPRKSELLEDDEDE